MREFEEPISFIGAGLLKDNTCSDGSGNNNHCDNGSDWNNGCRAGTENDNGCPAGSDKPPI